jgi:hypothetical protein
MCYQVWSAQMQNSVTGGGSVSAAEAMDCSEKPEEEDSVPDDCCHAIVGEKRGNGEVGEWNCLYDKLCHVRSALIPGLSHSLSGGTERRDTRTIHSGQISIELSTALKFFPSPAFIPGKLWKSAAKSIAFQLSNGPYFPSFLDWTSRSSTANVPVRVGKPGQWDVVDMSASGLRLLGH